MFDYVDVLEQRDMTCQLLFFILLGMKLFNLIIDLDASITGLVFRRNVTINAIYKL